jgi:phospholipase/lecithinase/hemolysin
LPHKRSCRLVVAVVLGLVGSATAAAEPFSDLVVFGDSLSDVGNVQQSIFTNIPGPYYWNGRFSNGPVYAESLATGLGLPTLVRSTASGGDYAYGGAKTSGTSFPTSIVVQDIDDQVGLFLSARTANASTLYVVFAGANDLIDGQTNMSVPVNSLANSIGRLVTAGARQFLVFNLPPLGYTPRYNGSQSTRDQYNTRSQQYNAALATMLNGVHASNPGYGLSARCSGDVQSSARHAAGVLADQCDELGRARPATRRHLVQHQSNRAQSESVFVLGRLASHRGGVRDPGATRARFVPPAR